MCQFLQISLEDLDGLLMGLPLVDSVRVEAGAFVVGFVPHDLVSAEEKLMVVIDAESPEGRRISEALHALASALGLGRAVSFIVHGGGAAFTIHDEAGGVTALGDPRFSPQQTLAALGALRDIASTSQILFLRSQRAAA